MTTATLNSALTLGRRFADDERGTFAMLLGLMFSVMLGILGIAIDYGRAIHTEDRLTNSLDAAALAAGRALIDGNMSDDEIKDMALKRLEENFKSGGGTPGSLTATEMTLNRATGAVTINTTAVVPTTFTSLFGVPSFTMPRDVAAIFDQQDIELAIQLDITGSMRGQKLQDLKEALNGKFADRYNDGSNPDEQGLFDILLPDQKGTNKVRIALAPYASGVNLGVAAAKEVTNDRHSGSGCTYDRAGSETTDDFVGSGTYFKGKADITGERDCPPNNTVRPMTEGANNKADREALKAEVDSYAVSTSTAGQLGSNWAWNLIAPKWGDFWKKHWGATAPVAY
jgi:Flp pilus assembly protein TadG